MTSPSKEFQSLVLEILGDVLKEYGYDFKSGYSRPRGVALEFVFQGHRIFSVCEEDTVAIDLILREDSSCYWRVSLNQALWFAGVKKVSAQATIEEQLALFASEIPRFCGSILLADFAALDSRYCFPLSSSEMGDYLAFQRGE